jgi:hypothetical protein
MRCPRGADRRRLSGYATVFRRDRREQHDVQTLPDVPHGGQSRVCRRGILAPYPSDPLGLRVADRAETIVCDHGKAYLSQAFRNACRAMGVTLQPSHEGSPWEKGTVETSFSAGLRLTVG